jgi:hypothetical protein
MAASATGMAACAAVFVASPLYQFGPLEGADCLARFVQLFMLSATMVDTMEDKQASSGIRSLTAVLWRFGLGRPNRRRSGASRGF